MIRVKTETTTPTVPVARGVLLLYKQKGEKKMNWIIVLGLLASVAAGILLGHATRTGRSVMQILSFLGVLAVAVVLLWIVVEIAGWVSLYSWIYATLENAGWAPDRYLLMAMTGLLTGIGHVIVPMIVRSLVSFKSMATTMMFTAVYCAMCLLLYTLAKPGEGQLANMKTGAPLMNCYRGADGLIEIYPEAIRFHPRYPGTPLQPCTADLIKEYDKQQKSSKDGKPLVWIPIKRAQEYVTAQYGKLNMWLEGLQGNDRTTLVYLACAGQTGGDFNGRGLLKPQGDSTYLTDQLGNVYRILEDKADYPSHKVKEGDTEKTILDDKEILPGQVYRFVLVFPPLGPETKSISLFHFQLREALAATLNPPPDHNADIDKVMGSAPIEWFKFKSNPVKAISSSQVGGSRGQGIELWVEQIGQNNQGTILTIVAALPKDGEKKRLYSAKAGAGGTYLQDDKDRKYALVEDLGDYKQEDGQPPFHELDSWYRLSLVFKPLVGKTSKVAFSHWQFEPIELNLQPDEPETSVATPSPAEQPNNGDNKAVPDTIPTEASKSTTVRGWEASSDPVIHNGDDQVPRKVTSVVRSDPQTGAVARSVVMTVGEPAEVEVVAYNVWNVRFKADSKLHSTILLLPSTATILVEDISPYSGLRQGRDNLIFVQAGDAPAFSVPVRGNQQRFNVKEMVPLRVIGIFDHGGPNEYLLRIRYANPDQVVDLERVAENLWRSSFKADQQWREVALSFPANSSLVVSEHVASYIGRKSLPRNNNIELRWDNGVVRFTLLPQWNGVVMPTRNYKRLFVRGGPAASGSDFCAIQIELRQ